MRDGRIEQLGPPRELYEQPLTRFVAGFIGTSNILGGTVESVGSDGAVVRTAVDERVVIPVRTHAAAGDPIAATVRPEKMRMTIERPASGCVLKARVDEVVYLGTSTNYSVTTGLGDLVVYQLNAGEEVAVPVRGDEVWVSWGPDHGLQLSDAEPVEETPNAE
jgi:spermidine/putrescine transport system ATP-binding protein